MSNRPFKDYSEKYIELAKQTLAPETIKTRTRRYNRMNNDVVALKAAGKISTMSPKEFTPEDVTVILLNHKANVGATDMAHEIVKYSGLRDDEWDFCDRHGYDSAMWYAEDEKEHEEILNDIQASRAKLQKYARKVLCDNKVTV